MKSFAERIKAIKEDKAFFEEKSRRLFKKWAKSWLKQSDQLDGFSVRKNATEEDHVLIFEDSAGSSMIISLRGDVLSACTQAIYKLELEPTSRDQAGWPSWNVACTEKELEKLDEALVQYMAS